MLKCSSIFTCFLSRRAEGSGKGFSMAIKHVAQRAEHDSASNYAVMQVKHVGAASSPVEIEACLLHNQLQ